MTSLVALLFALPKALLGMIVIVAFIVITELIEYRAHAWVRRAFFVCMFMFFPVTFGGLTLLGSSHSFSGADLVMLGICGFLILLYLPLIYGIWNANPAAQQPPIPLSTLISVHMRRELLIDLALVVCLLTVHHADIKGDMLWVSVLLVLAAFGANTFIHYRLGKRAEGGRPRRDRRCDRDGVLCILAEDKDQGRYAKARCCISYCDCLVRLRLFLRQLYHDIKCPGVMNQTPITLFAKMKQNSEWA
ncbi:MAG: hypothetical protein J2P54_03100 [Bradyrhizobiaceae bacterium]|nr:hypothetical protein [Bradyrhizobiaceae bacterium]